MSNYDILTGDVREQLKTLPDESVHCVVTSPPYWGLRDYGTASWEGGDADCGHLEPLSGNTRSGLSAAANKSDGGTRQPHERSDGRVNAAQYREKCGKCGATRIDNQLGLEPTPEQYVSNMVEVFREVRRVLRPDGTLWLNLGDSYAGSGSGGGGNQKGNETGLVWFEGRPTTNGHGLKPKDLVGIPWRVAFALQADGWVLRSDVVWNKPNPMPESVRDRPTKAHEMLFLLSKGKWTGPDPGRFAHISDEDARWIALLVDTEGNIQIKRVRRDGQGDQFGCQIAIAQVHRPLLERLQSIAGHGNILQRPGTNAPVHYWQVSNKVGRDLLYRIYPWLIVKSRQACIAMYLESLLYHRGGRTAKRKERSAKETDVLLSLWERNKQCNQFGDPDLSDVPEPKYGRWTSQPYFYDADAIAENGTFEAGHKRRAFTSPRAQAMGREPSGNEAHGWVIESGKRNKRSVWTVTTQPYPDAHFAVFPEALVVPCVKAGTSEHGVCECGTPWRRVVERTESSWARRQADGHVAGSATPTLAQQKQGSLSDGADRAAGGFGVPSSSRTTGWEPGCTCEADRKPATVLDPFCGSGTVGVVCSKLGRDFVGIELNPAYVEMAKNRIHNAPLSLFAL